MRVEKITRLKLVVKVRKYFIQLQARFSLKSPRRSNHIVNSMEAVSTIIVDEIVTVVLSNKIFQRKQSSQVWISEM